MEELEALVNRSVRGDLGAFGQIVRRFQDMAHGYAYSFLGDFHAAQDAAQEAFIDAFLKLDDLKVPAAFPGWFRQIVHSQCTHALRKRRIATVPLEAADSVTVHDHARTEMRDEVLAAIRALSEPQRVTTMLFYINGYSQNEIAEFLEVPVTTVQKRLHDSRNKLKKRMLEMVEDTLKEHVPDERFSKAVIDRLVKGPRPLDIPGHPVREVADAIRAALPGYVCIEGDEVVDKVIHAPLTSLPEAAYHVSENKVLRTHTTVTAFQAMIGRKPPVRLMVCGRVFRPDTEDTRRLKVFHQVDVLYIAPDATEAAMQATLQKVVEAALGPVELRQESISYPVIRNALDLSVKHNGAWVGVAGAGMVEDEVLQNSGFDPRAVQAFSFGMGLERLAMIKYGVEDIRSFWRPPYVCA